MTHVFIFCCACSGLQGVLKSIPAGGNTHSLPPRGRLDSSSNWAVGERLDYLKDSRQTLLWLEFYNPESRCYDPCRWLSPILLFSSYQVEGPTHMTLALLKVIALLPVQRPGSIKHYFRSTQSLQDNLIPLLN